MTDERGCLIRISAARPGRTHDITAARHEHIQDHLRAAGLGALADLGFRGLDNDVLDPVIVTGYTATRAHKLTPGQKDANRVLATGRAPVEHGFAHLKNWRTLTKLRTNPARATHLLRAPQDRHTSPLTCNFKLAEAQCRTSRHRARAPDEVHSRPPHRCAAPGAPPRI
ncbi:transposase family protein [Streptomyces scopuliridis]|uniref:transposase family protein n=1 Tax=Streptomyces scopuliridis TaxID=452529 RepID=UPI0036A92C18